MLDSFQLCRVEFGRFSCSISAASLLVLLVRGLVNFAFCNQSFVPEPFMGNKIITEAERRATPRPVAPKGVTFTAPRGQKCSLERGSHTRSKKNPGKRCSNGG
jgi:hypothetical protein